MFILLALTIGTITKAKESASSIKVTLVHIFSLLLFKSKLKNKCDY